MWESCISDLFLWGERTDKEPDTFLTTPLPETKPPNMYVKRQKDVADIFVYHILYDAWRAKSKEKIVYWDIVDNYKQML